MPFVLLQPTQTVLQRCVAGVARQKMYSSQPIRRGVGLDGLFERGDHVCHFYHAADDLGEVLVPYFKAGLERNERCLWVTAHPYGIERAASEMRVAMSDFDRRTAAGQIQIFDHDEWYAKLAVLSTAEKVQCWLSQKEEALALGFSGLRGSGNTSFLDEGSRDDFLIYERGVDEAFRDRRILALCSYPISMCSADAMLDVTHCHRHGLAKRHGHWDLIEVMSHGREVPGVEHDPRATSAWQGVELRQVIEDQLAIFIGAFPERISLSGGHVQLSPSQTAKLAVLFSELAANAARYGALSSTRGEVDVQWRIVVNGSGRLHIKWIEEGMSGLTIPDKIGLGTRLLAGTVQNCERVFHTTGMVCTFELDCAAPARAHLRELSS
jgi:MEDS: MEthanogen/methylotroph, DcmR Sensory domain